MIGCSEVMGYSVYASKPIVIYRQPLRRPEEPEERMVYFKDEPFHETLF